jgi:hypothetical protein
MTIFPSFFVNTTGGGYEIEQSLRFDGSSYLSRTPSAAGTLGTWTISYWAKRGKSGFNSIFNSGSVNQQGIIYMTDSSDVLAVLGFNSTGAAKGWSAYAGTGKLRDFSGWYHVLIRAFPSSSGKSYDGVELEIYINGKETGTTIAGGSPSGGCRINDGQAKTIGYNAPDGNYFNGYIAEWHLVDGTAAAVTDFGEYDNNGVWRPIEYTGSYGTQGYYLKFDPSATNGVGHDHSGNGNNFTATGFSTSGTGTDVMSDTPTTNWCTLNPLQQSNDTTLSDGNLRFAGSVSKGMICGTQGATSGKYYWEFIVDDSGQDMSVGITNLDETVLNLGSGGSIPGRNTWSWGLYMYPLNTYIKKVHNTVYTDTSATKVSNGDVIGIAYDAGAGKMWASKNNTWMDSGDPAAGTNALFTNLSGTLAPAVQPPGGGVSTTNTANFGQRAFAYTPPTGFNALNTANLPAPDIADGSQYFNTVLWTGNGVSGRAITGVGFQPDFLWIKRRNVSISHYLQNSIAGATYYMFSNTTVQERNLDDSVDSFDTDGFTLGNDGGTNGSGGTYVGWNWLAGGTGSSNTDGSITSTVSANPTAGFSIGTYTADGSNANRTVGHGLGVAPEFIIVKNRDTTGRHWLIWHKGFNDNDKALLFTDAAVADNRFGPSAPTSTVFGLYGGQGNYNSDDHVFYAFAGVEGYSKFGSYVGNGSASDGTFVYCGFRPRWIMVKSSSNSYGWAIHDTTRQTYNEDERILEPNTSGPEATNSAWGVDILSNGFKWRNDGEVFNFSGYTYIFAAFAENPFGGSGVSPATAR